jgi:hypothetical protein
LERKYSTTAFAIPRRARNQSGGRRWIDSRNLSSKLGCPSLGISSNVHSGTSDLMLTDLAAGKKAANQEAFSCKASGGGAANSDLLTMSLAYSGMPSRANALANLSRESSIC